MPFYVVLLHFPIRDRKGQEVVTSVTNLDLHDISRSARTYGAKGYFVVTPLPEQHEVVNRILNHWQKSESSQSWHPDRVEALSLVRLVKDFEAVKAQIRLETGQDPEVILTDARPLKKATSYKALRAEFPSQKRPIALCFGTGWGISESFYSEVHRILDPVYGPEKENGYNHLSVRAAAAVILDRLFGE